MYSCMVHSPPPVPISPSGSHCHSATSSWGYHLLGQCLHWSGTTLFLCLSQSCSLSLVLNLPLLLQYLLYSEHVLILILFPVQNREQFQRSYHGLRLLMLSATISWLTLGVASLIRTLNTWVGNYTGCRWVWLVWWCTCIIVCLRDGGGYQADVSHSPADV